MKSGVCILEQTFGKKSLKICSKASLASSAVDQPSRAFTNPITCEAIIVLIRPITHCGYKDWGCLTMVISVLNAVDSTSFLKQIPLHPYNEKFRDGIGLTCRSELSFFLFIRHLKVYFSIMAGRTVERDRININWKDPANTYLGHCLNRLNAFLVDPE